MKRLALLLTIAIVFLTTACSMEEFDEKTDKIEKKLDDTEEKATKAIEKKTGQSTKDKKKSSNKKTKEKKKELEIDYSQFASGNAFITMFNETYPDKSITREMVTSCDTAAGGETTIQTDHVVTDIGYADGSIMINFGTKLKSSDKNREVFLKDVVPYLSIAFKLCSIDHQMAQKAIDNIKEQRAKDFTAEEDFFCYTKIEDKRGIDYNISYNEPGGSMDIANGHFDTAYEIALYERAW